MAEPVLATGRVYGMTAGMGAPRLGAHLGGGIAGAIAEARRIGLGVDGAPGGPIQVWSQNPSGWRASVPKAKVVDDFRRGCVELDLWPVVTHGIYLMNFASPDDANWEKAIDALVVHLEVGAMIGAAAVVVHPGSGVTLGPDEAIARCALAMTKVLERTETLDARPIVALETCAGAGKTIGKTFSELAAIVEGAGRHPGLGLCLDTAHLFGSGYDVATESGLAGTIADLEAHLTGVPLIAIHANDSKVPLGSNKDRHENIGQGLIGEDAFARMLSHPRLRHVPWILEVPGMENDGPDAANIAILRRLAG